MNDLNGSSYYRANPYYQQGYLPDGAYKNRELPQGEEFFQPTNKKHFQRIGYYSTIAQQKIMNSGVRQENFSPIKDRQYFRSLNVGDIEGASTNTLISKGVKNKMRAQQQLAKRHYEQQQIETYQRMKMLQRMDEEKKRMEALNKINKHSEPNYHQLNRKIKLQNQQTRKQEPNQAYMQNKVDQRNSQAEYHLQGQSKQDRGMKKGTDTQGSHQMNSYRQQLQKTDREILQLEQQLSQVRDQKQRVQKEHQKIYQDANPITPVTYQNKYQINSYLPRHQNTQPNPQQLYSNYNHQKSHQQLYQQGLNQQKRFEEQKLANASLEKQLQEYKKTQHFEQKQEKIDPVFQLGGKLSKEQHRRFNPTYLSYGSPSIGLAGKNIVKY